MKNVIKMSVVILMMTLTAATVVCQSRNTENGLVGKWFFPDFDGEIVILTFSERLLTRQSLEYNDIESIDFRYDNKSIYVREARGEEKWLDYEIQNSDVLILMEPEDHSERFMGKRIQNNNRVSSLSGKYINSNKVGLFESLEFLDRTNVRITGISMMGYRSPPFGGKYEISGSNLIITSSGDTIIFEIISDTIITGSAGFTDAVTVFIKQ
ncbi:MAG: hypothetical protein LBI03_04425 [Clostridiales bacterium]|nr:hypothetical protein [Clostridiales bacterium]